jgi:hypothetical protein
VWYGTFKYHRNMSIRNCCKMRHAKKMHRHRRKSGLRRNKVQFHTRLRMYTIKRLRLIHIAQGCIMYNFQSRSIVSIDVVVFECIYVCKMIVDSQVSILHTHGFNISTVNTQNLVPICSPYGLASVPITPATNSSKYTIRPSTKSGAPCMQSVDK